jgi:hypothetical protein
MANDSESSDLAKPLLPLGWISRVTEYPGSAGRPEDFISAQIGSLQAFMARSGEAEEVAPFPMEASRRKYLATFFTGAIELVPDHLVNVGLFELPSQSNLSISGHYWFAHLS